MWFWTWPETKSDDLMIMKVVQIDSTGVGAIIWSLLVVEISKS